MQSLNQSIYQTTLKIPFTILKIPRSIPKHQPVKASSTGACVGPLKVRVYNGVSARTDEALPTSVTAASVFVNTTRILVGGGVW